MRNNNTYIVVLRIAFVYFDAKSSEIFLIKYFYTSKYNYDSKIYV